jgi:GNAT superfamily N-acetyltransferase
MTIQIVETDSQIAACFPVMAQLRPHLLEEEFVPREEEGQVLAVAGFRISECLAWGKFLYVDDLVTDEAARSRGHGKALLDWLVDFARSQDCEALHLDSGVQRFDAHRFYFQQRMAITSYHFALQLPDTNE